MQKIITLIRHEGYVLLVCTLGVVGIIEGLRVDAKVQSASFLSGPGGYLTIIGISLLLFGIIDIIRQLILRHTSKRVPDVARMDNTQGADRTRIHLTLDRSSMGPTMKMQLSYVLCVVYVLLIRPLGFTVATILYLVANLWVLSNKTKTIVFTAIVMFFILRFGLPAMGLSVPKGIFGW
jgi:hypothetical protein